MNQELMERIDLIERMVMEGRRSTQYWGWNFVLWGAGQLAALAWSAYGGRPGLAWGVTMAACGILTGIFIAVQRRGPQTSESLTTRALWAMWFSLGITISLLAFLGNPRGLFTLRSFAAIFLAMMGLTNVASGLILRWRPQISMGLLWWAAAVFTIFGPEEFIPWILVGMIIAGEVLFGLYLMAKERADRRHARPA
jgi:hypothetical protein